MIHGMHFDEPKEIWEVKISRGDKEERVVKARHVVFAIGTGSGVPIMPEVPGMDKLKGTPSFQTISAPREITLERRGHWLSALVLPRFYNYDIDPVLFKGPYEENDPLTEAADVLTASLPLYFGRVMIRRVIAEIAEKDRDILEALDEVGFKTNSGVDGSGFAFIAAVKAGGYYLDVGISRLITDQKIKFVSSTNLSHFTDNSVVFENGQEVQADIVCATRFVSHFAFFIYELVVLTNLEASETVEDPSSTRPRCQAEAYLGIG
ncbi:hypothetical protein BYT27DRAFT_7253338 [Phlegmacium glaucopus]|nr:hypothetical protein BYT27DRAFT_7253338 [Phlegmacium glaucopus]